MGQHGSPDKTGKEAVNDLDPGTVVYHLFDNSIYCTKDWDGSRLPPKPLEDGKHHMIGEQLVEAKDAQREMLQELKPLLALEDRRNVIIITPMPCYLKSSCCEDKKHITNRNESSFKQNMMWALAETKQNIKDIHFLRSTAR
jgi:hypothetical protein